MDDDALGRAEEALGRAEARTTAILRAIPDLMFVMRRDGTYVDYYARDTKLLFVPPSEFLGRNVRDILPAALVDPIVDALERTSHSNSPTIVEYQLPMAGEQRFYEARIVTAGEDLLLSIVRDVTETKRAVDLTRDLARRLIASQELERQRIALELHDDISQRIAMLNIELDEIAADLDDGRLRARLHRLSAQTREIAGDVHTLSFELHPSKLQVIGLVAGMSSLCRAVSSAGNVQVRFTHRLIPAALETDVSLGVYRILQEALHNIVRHSHAHRAEVQIVCDENQITLKISDSGVGFDPEDVPSTGLGLASMQGRVAVLRGEFIIDAAPGAGTRIDVRIPLVVGATVPGS